MIVHIPILWSLQKLALNRQSFLHTCIRFSHMILAYWAGILRDGYICLYVHMAINTLWYPHIHLYICMSIIMFICPSLYSYICWYIYTCHFICTSIRTLLSNIGSLHPCLIAWETSSHLIWYLGIPDIMGFIYRWGIFTLAVCSFMQDDTFFSHTSRVVPVVGCSLGVTKPPS